MTMMTFETKTVGTTKRLAAPHGHRGSATYTQQERGSCRNTIWLGRHDNSRADRQLSRGRGCGPERRRRRRSFEGAHEGLASRQSPARSRSSHRRPFASTDIGASVRLRLVCCRGELTLLFFVRSAHVSVHPARCSSATPATFEVLSRCQLRRTRRERYHIFNFSECQGAANSHGAQFPALSTKAARNLDRGKGPTR